ncbi:MAG: VCBS repeat-containing protein, partial [Actinobacteria bacterium]|nr:VCBS repeat-containing protein [Actinomycetota bacterium]
MTNAKALSLSLPPPPLALAVAVGLWLSPSVLAQQLVAAGKRDWTGGRTHAFAVGDVDGDGLPDIVAARYQLDGLQLGRGKGRFVDVSATHLPPLAENTLAVALGDLDADGDPDLVMGNVGGGGAPAPNRVYLNDGTGRFADVTSTHLSGANLELTFGVALGDVDGDGDPDLVFANRPSPSGLGRSQLFLNDGTGPFVEVTSTHLPAGSYSTAEILLVDVDGDGDRDMAIANEFGSDLLYLNDGSGHFSDASSRMPSSFGSFDIAAADVDGDGDADLVKAVNGPNQLLLNDGRGFFDDASFRLPASSQLTRDVELVDADGDGDVDVLFGNWGSKSANELGVNDGHGFFTRSSGLPPAEGWTHAVLLVDLTGDGLADILEGNVPGADRFYENQGGGRTRRVPRLGIAQPVLPRGQRRGRGLRRCGRRRRSGPGPGEGGRSASGQGLREPPVPQRPHRLVRRGGFPPAARPEQHG